MCLTVVAGLIAAVVMYNFYRWFPTVRPQRMYVFDRGRWPHCCCGHVQLLPLVPHGEATKDVCV
jgi:hypothetical protein